MANIFKRTISFVLAMLMVMSLLPGVGHVHAHAEEGEQETTAVTVPVEETTAPAVEETVTQETVGELSPLNNIVDVQSAGAIMPLATTKDFSGCTVDGLGISATDADGSGTPTANWLASGTTITGSLVGGIDATGTIQYYYESTTTMTLTNNKKAEAQLSFKYSVTSNGKKYGDITVNGTKYTSSATDKEVSVTLNAGESITIKLHVPQRYAIRKLPDPNGAYITITDIKLVSQGGVTVNFDAAENGSYTVTDASGAAVTVPGTASAKSTDNFTMTATPADGYVFAGWYNVTTGTYLSADLTYTTLFGDDATIKPLFVLAADGVYGVGNAAFTDLTDAAKAAENSTAKTVVLLKNATLTGSHTIPMGVTLLIPYDATHTLNTNVPTSVTVNHSTPSAANYVKYEKPSAFRTLTMASGASITVNGAISVNAIHESCVGGQIYGGQVLGKYGCIKMTSGSSITLSNGSYLYAWGYIWGDGTVTAKSGATIYEKMQVTDYRGGSNTSAIAMRNMFSKSDGAFPFNQYYIQNVEVKEVLHEGATLMAHAAVNLAGETPAEAAVEFIGTSTAMFTVSGATITKEYHPETDRLSLTVDGDENSSMEMNGMKLSMSGLSIDSANYTLPINGNIDINVNAGYATVNQELVLQPGVKVFIDEDAILGTNADIYVMDLDQWGAFVFSAKRQQAVVYTPSLNGPSTRTINSDAVIDINGYVIPVGGIFTTAGGAKIISSGKTGIIEFFGDAPADGTVYQLTGGSDKFAIAATAAQLTNGNANKPFTATKGAAEGDVFFYCPKCDSWHRETDECAPTTLPAVEITWIGANGANLGTQEFEMNTVPVYNGTPTKAQSGCTTYTFAGWSTEANGGGTKYAVGTALPAATADATYYAYFTEGTSHTKVVTDAKVAATCTTDGKTEGSHCEACGTVIVAQTTISATGHDMQKTADQVDATCEKDGKTAIYTCANNCGKTEGGAVIPATKHNMQQSAAKVDATCEKDGKEAVYTCANNCGKTEGGAVIPATGHDMQKTADQVDATCEGDGKTAIFTCANNCGKTEGGAVIPATGHDMQKTADQVDATCEADGKTAVYTCANNCGKTEGGDVIPATGHTNGAPVTENKVEADCDDDGSYDTVVYCSVCGEELSRETTVVPATGHTSGASSIENKVDATCEDKGGYDEVTYCLICGVETSRNHVVTPAKGHTAGASVKENEVAATCGADGSYDTVIYCSVCGEEQSRETTTVPATGAHVYATETERVEATCTVDGYVIMACGCGATEKTTLSAPGHTAGEAVEENKVPADCENDGSYDTVVYCSVCGEELSRVTSTIPALGHSEPVYTNNGDTHSVDYPCCDGLDVVSENHSYENGQCICGAREPFTVGVVNSYGVADTITLSNPIAIPGQDYVTTISGTVGTSFGIVSVYDAAGEWIDPYFCCIFDGETNTLTVRGEYVDEGMKLGIVSWVTATYYLNGGYVNDRYDTSFVPDANGAFTWEWNCGDYPFSFWSSDFGTTHDGNFAFEREGYTLVGYNTAADGSGTMYGFEQKVAHTEDIVLYMIWECNHDTWQDATCTAPKTCATCGKTEGEALGHSEPVYSNNGDTHSAVYPCCGEAYVTDEPHDFENEDHKCVCGLVESHTVTFTVLGQVYDTVTVTYGEKIALPETDPEVEGYRFNGWKNVPNSMPDNDLTIEADLVEQVTISYYRYNGDTYQYEYDYDVTVDKGAEVKLPYYYWNYSNTLGWDANDDGVVDYEYNETINANESLTLKPVLVPFYANVNLGAEDAVFVDAEGNPITRIYAENAYINEIILTNHPTRVGYTFLGWLVDGSENLVYTNEETGKLEVRLFFGDNYSATALWKINTHTVTFTVNGEYYADAQVKYGQIVTAPEYVIPEGHSFSGWTVPDTMPDADITLDATLTANTHTVTFTVNGEYYAEVEVKYGQSITAPEYVIPEGHTFSGWTVPGTMPDTDITLDATLTVNTYTVTFTVNGEYYAKAEIKYGQSVTAPEFEIPEGHSFSGWTVSDTMPAEDITLDATLTVNTYTVTFTVNGEYYADAQVKYGQIVTAPEYVIPEGHSFSGWTVPDTMPAKDITLDAALTVNVYELSIFVGDHVDENGVCYTEISLQVPYGALLKDYLVETPDLIANTDAQQGKYTFAYWHTYASNVALDTETATMPANYIRYYATYDYTGWYIEEGGKYFVDHYEAIAGWFCVNDKNELVTDGSGDWYYIDPYRPYTNTGVSRAPYPAEAINGITYAPDQESLDYGNTHYGYFIDEKEAWFIFDEDGKFQYAETGMVTYQGETRYAVNGMLPWHVGLVQIGEDYYYFIGDTEIGGNIMATGNVYMSRNNTDLDVVTSGVYTYGADGKLLKADGITDVNGTLYYYEDYQLMIGAGLIKIDEDYYYVRSNGALVVDCEYWVGDNKFGIVEGTYQFDENGKLVLPVFEYRNGVYAEDGGLFYYINGNRTYAGLIEWNGGWIYVRSNGQLAVGRYWTTKHNDVKPEGFYDFDENGMLIEQKNGIINENGTLYYYINNEKQYNSGVIQLNGNYYYVRSNGVVVAGQNYWITNVGTSGVVAKQYTFDANGVMQNPEFAVNVKEGVVDGYYYENGKIVYGAGLIEWNGDYYYVRSNGQVATGEYWITTTNGLKPQGKYNFGTDGKMILN